MKKVLIAALFLTLSVIAEAQEVFPFKGKIYNEEFQVWIEMNFYDNNVTVPGQKVLGELPGYLGAKRDTRKWLIMDAEISNNVAQVSIINDYGSEDLTATLKINDDGSYTLERTDGSVIKIVVNRKWVKLPKKLTFIRE